MVKLVPAYQWPRFDLRFVATGFVVPSLICSTTVELEGERLSVVKPCLMFLKRGFSF